MSASSLRPTRRASQGPACCQAPGCGKPLSPNESFSQAKLYCSARCRKQVARAKVKEATPARQVTCRRAGCGQSFPARGTKAYCGAGCKSPVARGEGGQRFETSKSTLAALVALGGRASVLRIAGRAGLTVARCATALCRLQEAGRARLHREPGAPEADWIGEAA